MREGEFAESERARRTQGANASNSRINDDGTSQSGGERNHLFWSQGGAQFEDISGLAGVDNPADGRAFVVWDYDSDGFQDLAVANANAPLLNLYRNRLGDTEAAANWVALRATGGNDTAQPSEEWSNRSAVGLRVAVHVGDAVLHRQWRAGEGLASQNSARLVIGLGEAERIDRIELTWPSGRTAVLEDLPVNVEHHLQERPSAGTAPLQSQ